MRNGVNIAYVVTPTKFRPLKMPVTPFPAIFPTEENLSLDLYLLSPSLF